MGTPAACNDKKEMGTESTEFHCCKFECKPVSTCARMVEPTLSPRAAIGADGGPRNRNPAALRDLGKSGFSDA